jgi:hypothetical protein
MRCFAPGRALFPIVCLLVCASPVWAQPSLPSEWDLKQDLDAATQRIGALRPLLELVQPEQWAERDSVGTYQAQRRYVLEEIGYITRGLTELIATPDRLSLALDVLFRVQSLDQMTSSLAVGVRTHQSVELADQIRASQTAAAAEREKLKNYILGLAAYQEAQFKVMSEEAQRCRNELLRQTPARGSRSRGTEAK